MRPLSPERKLAITTRSRLEPDAGPSRQLIGDLIYECGYITHLPIVSRRCGPAIVNLARLIGINVPADHGSPVFDWAFSNADPPEVSSFLVLPSLCDGVTIVSYGHSELGVLYPERGVAELPVPDREHDILIETETPNRQT